MKMSPLTLYCEHCGAANTTEDTKCFACQEPLQVSEPTSFAHAPVLPLLTPSPSPTPSEQVLPGALLHHRYEVVSEVGQGGFSVVYAARDTQHKNKKVAIKQINLRELPPRQVIEATDTYNREVRLLTKFKHAKLKHLPHIYDHFTDPDHWYLVMDFIEGETLEDSVLKTKEGYLPIEEVLTIGIQVSRVLHYLHSHKPPIIFRDVKPSNIMRTPKGHLYLIDFGIARHFSPGQHKDTGPLGSPGYAAPEQYGTAQTTAQADIYSLGVTLEALLSGQDPLEPAPTPGQPLPQKLRQVLDRMLEQEAHKRPTALEVQLQLTDMQQGKKGKVFSSLWGLLLGSMPYPLLLLLLFSMTSFPQLNVLAVLYAVLLITWPIVLVVQLIIALDFLFSPQWRNRRLMGLGMLTMLVLLAIALKLGWLPSPLSPGFLNFLD
jgi:serine/threonine protein kinase